MDEKLIEKVMHEVCSVCIHKPTKVEDGLFEDSPKTLKGLGCTYGYEEGSNNFCPIAHKTARAIIPLVAGEIAGFVLKEVEERYRKEIIGVEPTGDYLSTRNKIQARFDKWMDNREEITKALRTQCGFGG